LLLALALPGSSWLGSFGCLGSRPPEAQHNRLQKWQRRSLPSPPYVSCVLTQPYVALACGFAPTRQESLKVGWEWLPSWVHLLLEKLVIN
jgi:hypothetical protein